MTEVERPELLSVKPIEKEQSQNTELLNLNAVIRLGEGAGGEAQGAQRLGFGPGPALNAAALGPALSTCVTAQVTQRATSSAWTPKPA